MRDKLLQIRMSDKDLTELKAIAANKGLSASAYARFAIKEAIEKEKQKHLANMR